MPRLKSVDAEREFEKWLQERHWRTHRAMSVQRRNRSGGYSTKRHDLWGAFDILALKPRVVKGEVMVWAIQVTTPDGRTARKKKIAKLDWPAEWRISVITHETRPNVAHAGKTDRFWKITDLVNGVWGEYEVVEA